MSQDSIISLKNVIDGISGETTMNKLAIKIGTALMLEARITIFKDEEKDKYKLLPALIYSDRWVESYKKSGIPYLLSGLKSMHVNYAIEVIEKHDDLTMEQVWNVFEKIVHNNKHNFYSSDILTQYM